MLAWAEITTNGSIDRIPETPTSNASYVPAAV